MAEIPQDATSKSAPEPNDESPDQQFSVLPDTDETKQAPSSSSEERTGSQSIATSDAADVAAAPSRLDYSAALARIPGFESYAQKLGSSDGDHNDDTGATTLDGRNRYSGGQMSRLQTSSVQDLSERHVVNTDQNFLDVVRKLKSASKGRRNIVQLEVQVSNIHRRLADLYNVLDSQIQESLQFVQHTFRSLGTVNQAWQQDVRTMNNLSEQIAAAQEELDPLEVKLVSAHWAVKDVEDDVYAIFAGGTRPSESEISSEDRQFDRLRRDSDADATLADLGERPLLNYYDVSPGESRPLPISQVPFSETAVSEPKQELLLQSPAQSIAAVPGVAHNTPGPEGAHDWEVLSRTNSHTANPKRSEWPRLRVSQPGGSFDAESVGIATIFNGEVRPMEEIIDASRKSSALVCTADMMKFRAEDFRVALGLDLKSLGESILRRDDHRRTPLSQRNAVRLSNIRVPVLKQNVLIAFWGREMSQNSILEGWRTQSYGGRKLENLIKQGKVRPLHHYVQDIRRIKPRFDSDWGPDTLVSAYDDARSISVQPPGSVRTFAESSGQRSELDLVRLGREITPRT